MNSVGNCNFRSLFSLKTVKKRGMGYVPGCELSESSDV